MATEQQFVFQAPVESPSTLSNQSDYTLVPYCEVNGIRTLSDQFLAGVFSKMVNEGTLKAVFPTAKMDSAQDFIAWMKKPGNIPVFALDTSKDYACHGGECLMFSWLNDIGPNYAYGHFCYFESCIDRVAIGKEVVKHWFSLGGDKPYLDMLLGVIPTFNKAAIGFIQKVGMTLVGEIPLMCTNPFTHEKCSAAILYILR